MVSITEVVIISIDKEDDFWDIEGEVLFETDLASPFSAVYCPNDDDFEELELEINPGGYDKSLLKRMIIAAAEDCDD